MSDDAMINRALAYFDGLPALPAPFTREKPVDQPHWAVRLELGPEPERRGVQFGIGFDGVIVSPLLTVAEMRAVPTLPNDIGLRGLVKDRFAEACGSAVRAWMGMPGV